MTGPTTIQLQACLERMRAGDSEARDELLRHSQNRLGALTHRMLTRYRGVRRWEETVDVLQLLLMRLDSMLREVEIGTVRDFLRLAATYLRRLLIDLARRHSGPHGLNSHFSPPRPTALTNPEDQEPPSDSSKWEPGEPLTEAYDEATVLAGWGEFHDHVGQLPEEEREVFDLIWYHGMRHEDVAEMLGVSLITVRRRWQDARIHLMELLGGEAPF